MGKYEEEEEDHITDTNSFYNAIMQYIIQASDTAFSKHNPTNGSVNPGWSDYEQNCTVLLRMSLICGGIAGKPRQGYLVELHRTAIDYLDINKSCDIDGIYGEEEEEEELY